MEIDFRKPFLITTSKKLSMKTSLRHSFYLLPICFAIFFSSCTAYQYATLSSSLPKSQYNDFFFENDTVQIVYSFSGMDCPFVIDIFNKLDKPIYINWPQSAVVVNGETKPINNSAGVSNTYDDFEVYTDVNNNSNTTIVNNGYGRVNSRSLNSFNTSVIPAKSQLTIDHLTLKSSFIDITQAESQERTPITAYTTEPINVKKYNFSHGSSPFKFRSFITYSDDSNFNTKHCVDDEFWVSSVFRSASGQVKNSKDTYYVSKTTGFGNFMIGAAVVVGLTLYVIVEASKAETAE